MEKLLLGLTIMGRGMVGIFVVILLIMAGVMLMNRLAADKPESDK